MSEEGIKHNSASVVAPADGVVGTAENNSYASGPAGISYAALACDEFAGFVDTIATLRAPGGCPWDREQTHASIARNMIEEAYEAVDAIEKGSVEHLREELGDVLLQVVLQSQIAADAGEFNIADVCHDVNEKIVRRHPHVFGQASASSAQSVLALWDAVKLAEKSAADAQVAGISNGAGGTGNVAAAAESGSTAGAEGTSGIAAAGAIAKGAAGLGAAVGATTGAAQPVQPEGLLDSVPSSLPALMQAYKISRKAVSAGFEWETIDAVWAQVEEEIAEFKEACTQDDAAAMELELGDVLFSLVNVARKVGIDAETALRASCSKFRRRWAFMEGVCWARGVRIETLSTDELQALWDEAKVACAQDAAATGVAGVHESAGAAGAGVAAAGNAARAGEGAAVCASTASAGKPASVGAPTNTQA